MTIEETVAIVIVFDVKRAPHPGRHLQHKAKGAEIVAAADVSVKSRVRKIEAQRPVVLAVAADGKLVALAPHRQLDMLLGRVKLHINYILDGDAIDRQQFVAGLEAQHGRYAARLHSGHTATARSLRGNDVFLVATVDRVGGRRGARR